MDPTERWQAHSLPREREQASENVLANNEHVQQKVHQPKHYDLSLQNSSQTHGPVPSQML